jgi:hypothetical protein
MYKASPVPNHNPRNVTAVWLALLFRNREVPGSNLSAETAYFEELRAFPRSLQENAGIIS